MTLRGLIGAVCGFVAVLVLLLCLAETRERFGRSEWGVYWVGRNRIVHFHAIWWPLLYLTIFAAPACYFLADRMRTRRAVYWALAGAIILPALVWLLPAAGRVDHERAEANLQLMMSLVLAMLGGAAGAGLSERLGRTRMPGDSGDRRMRGFQRRDRDP